MTELELGTLEQLEAAVDAMSNEQLNEAVARQDGGVDRALDQVFDGMRRAFDPARAAGDLFFAQTYQSWFDRRAAS
jgi:hypothetical protein